MQAGTAAQSGSILGRIDRLPPSRYLMLVIARIATGGWFEFYELFMPGFILPGFVRSGIYTVQNKGLFDYHSFASFLASFFLGMFLSTAIFGYVADRIGRRAVFVYSMAVYSVAQVAIALLADPLLIDLARFVAGCAVGMQLVNNDSYMAELTPRSQRGKYMTTSFVFVLSAIPVAAFLASWLVPHDPLGLAGWRWVVVIGALSGIAVFFIQRGLPESPRWLETHGRTAEADAVVARIERGVIAERGGTPLPAPDPNVVDLPPQQGRWSEMFSPFYLPRTLMISVFQFSQTIAVFGFTSFVPILLVKQGFPFVHSLTFTAIIVVCAPLGALVGSYFSERVERKWQLVFTALLIGVAGSLFATARYLPLIVVCGALVALGNNWLISVFHPYAAELFPTRIRGQAIGFTFSWSRVSSIFVGYWVGNLLAAYGTAGVFTMIDAAMLAIVIGIGVFGPATNGRSLEELSP
jgi:putative MFS transporter